jgi:Kef-type K+ transport system membrane component KefB
LSSNAHHRLLLLLQTKTATFASFLLFVGVAVSITAFPVLARILTDQGLTQSKVGIIALSSAAVDDVTYRPPPRRVTLRLANQ